MRFLNTKYGRIVTVFLVLQVFAFYAIASRPEKIPLVGPLDNFPTTLGGGWMGVRDFPIEQETLDVLRADDTLDRLYVDATNRGAFLFIAFFKTQRYGQSPHSPRNCLPGAGWEPVPGMSSRPALQEPGEAQPIVINKFVTEHGEDRSVTLYWYQSHKRIIASEWSAKFWSIADSVRYDRSDTSIVKVTVPVKDGDVNAATGTGYDFIHAMFPALLRQLPQ